jgi:hypothetical protein
MTDHPKKNHPVSGGNAEQPSLWAENGGQGGKSGSGSQSAQGRAAKQNAPERKSLQDLLFKEGLVAARLSVTATSLDELQQLLVAQFGQNSLETRTRYAQSVLRWFFPGDLNSIARRAWMAYEDEQIECDILR